MRYRRKLEDERHKMVEKALKSIPDYHPPSDYRRPAKTQEKVYVPVNDYPEINFSKILTLTSKPVCSATTAVLFLFFHLLSLRLVRMDNVAALLLTKTKHPQS